jgi:homogentisate 1,2-dioxygenase
MIDRQSHGILPPKPHTVAKTPDGRLLYEEMHTRGGFDGPFTYFYHLYPVTAAREVRATDRGWPRPLVCEEALVPLKRRLYDSGKIPAGGRLADDRTPILYNDQLTIWLARPTASDDVYVADADGDELWFVHEGRARLESPCGWLDVGAGDYVFVPHAMIHRWHLQSSSLRMLGVQAKKGMFIPDNFRNPVGQLRMDAPYTHRDFVRPSGTIAAFDRPIDGPTELLIVKNGRASMHVLERCPMDVVGWDGFVYPFAFDIRKYQPKTGMVHLPPTIHTTFVGSGAAVCSFVPRVTDWGKDAIPCPYPHSSVDCDEIILYLEGNFTSRRGVGPGCISLHPAGVVHGPHPGAYEASVGTTRTDELAVRIDTFAPLMPTAQAANIENPEYQDSWRIESR